MKKWLLFSLTTACLLLLFCLAAQAESFSYLAPKRSNPPIIDGNGNDHAWQDALTIRLSGKDNKTTGWILNPDLDSAEATVSVVWSETEGKEGIYFKWDVDDPTQSCPVLRNTALLNGQDCVQLLIDPMYKRLNFKNDCALCYTFAPYTATVPDFPLANGDACWWEHWYRNAGMLKAIGNKFASSLKYQGGNTVCGYVLELFLPFSALEINGQKIKTITEYKTCIGIGFVLIDYSFNETRYNQKEYKSMRELENILMNFGTSQNSLYNPSLYTTLYFGDEQSPGMIFADKTKQEVPSIGPEDTNRQWLEHVINSAANLKQQNFTQESWATMMNAYTAAILVDYNTNATQDQLDMAASELSASLLELQRLDSAAEPTVFSPGQPLRFYTIVIGGTIAVGLAGSAFLTFLVVKGKRKERAMQDDISSASNDSHPV